MQVDWTILWPTLSMKIKCFFFHIGNRWIKCDSQLIWSLMHFSWDKKGSTKGMLLSLDTCDLPVWYILFVLPFKTHQKSDWILRPKLSPFANWSIYVGPSKHRKVILSPMLSRSLNSWDSFFIEDGLQCFQDDLHSYQFWWGANKNVYRIGHFLDQKGLPSFYFTRLL